MILRFLFSLALALLGSTAALASSGYRQITLPAADLKSVPDGFIPCGNDFQRCELHSTAGNAIVTVFYGANGTYIAARGQGAFDCAPATFRVNDPVPNVKKACWIFAGYTASGIAGVAGSSNSPTKASVPERMFACAVDFAQCNNTSVSGFWVGVYGAGNTFKTIAGYGPFECIPGTFSIPDPVENTQKTCYVQAVQFGTFTVAESGSLPAGVTKQYSVISGEGTKVWDVLYYALPGTKIEHLPSNATFSVNVLLGNIPSDYRITVYGRTYDIRGIAIDIGALKIGRNVDYTGTVSYSYTAPSKSNPIGMIDQPVLSISSN